jgi:type IX secretion system PorP/SprF family membrane protein
MTLVNKIIFSTALLILTTAYLCVAQQYPVFTQYYFNELVINPAYAGAHVQFSATAMYRNQWVNFPGAPKTINFTTHTSLVRNKIGVGLMVNHDEIGSYKNEQIYGSYSYKIHFKDATLSMGLQAGLNLTGADFSNLDLQNTTDPSFYRITKQAKPNFGAGLYFSKKNFFLGFSVPFIVNTKLSKVTENLSSVIQEARYYFLRGGLVLPLDRLDKVKINPSFLVRTQEGQPLSFDINNAFIFYDVFSVGTSYRLGDSFITFIDLKLSDKIHFAYSYDWTQSNINRFGKGTHEFMINFRSVIRSIHGNPECPSYYHYR